MKNSEPAFSIIVPIYNGASVIVRCIESVIQQTYDAYELILIDDGSTDDTAEICYRYSIEYSNIQYIKQENKGVSGARNRGLLLAKNEFVLFVDADDYLLPNYLLDFKKIILDEHLDNKTIVFQDYTVEHVDKNGERHEYDWCKFSYKRYTLTEAFEDLPNFNWFTWGVPFVKLFRLSVIRDNQLLFDEQMTLNEDLVFMLYYMKYIDNMILQPVSNYRYTVDKGVESLSSVVASFNNELSFFKHIRQLSEFFIHKLRLSSEAQAVLYKYNYTSLFKSINSCLYKHKVPVRRSKRIQNIQLAASGDNLQQLRKSGIIDTRHKQIAFALLNARQYWLYDLLNQIRYK